jgi:predicted Ser/Thr protein kinase
MVSMATDQDEPDTLVRGALEVEEREDTNVSSHYAMGEVIGRGGMGEVALALDRKIGRDVAIKRLRADAPSEDDVARFLREARIQARLDHPAIVPVYELGKDQAGKPYFTMKRLVGTTLTEMLANPTTTRQRLLRAFADVCRAIDFAHTRGVVHRDLKPSNIVLGEFGDVYVLDWGVARVLEDAVIAADIETLEGSTQDKQILGSPGYIAPEGLRSAEVERPADIYSLGAILFEILAAEPVHPRGEAAIASTLTGNSQSPAKRRADRNPRDSGRRVINTTDAAIPPELDALCSMMLAAEPSLRPTARRVADQIESFLDGDRDHARRKTLADDLVWTARAALDEGRRGDAMRAAGRALALDPETEGAAELITALMLEPPTEPPAELDAALREADSKHIRRRARTAMLAYVALASFLPIAAWNGIRRWDVVIGVFSFAIAMAVATIELRRKPNRTFVEMLLYACVNAALLVMLTRLAGPFTFVPALACFMVMSMMSYPAFTARRWTPWVLISTIVAGFVGPILLEQAGLLHQTWELRNGELVSHAGALELNGTTSVTMVIVASLVTIVVAGIHASSIARAFRQQQHQLVTQAWHLGQLLPATRAPS